MLFCSYSNNPHRGLITLSKLLSIAFITALPTRETKTQKDQHCRLQIIADLNAAHEVESQEESGGTKGHPTPLLVEPH